MKKYLIASIVALTVALVGVSVSASFDRNMSVGSTGADVTALQNTLIAKGYSIPAGATGYFGQQTLAAVKLFQAANSVPNTGFVGLLTRGVLNGSPAVATAMTLPFPCPVGYTAPAGWVCPGTVTTGPVTMTGTDGSVSVSQSSYVSSGIQVKKGETKDVVAVRLQATAGPVNLSRVDVHFSVRPWLFFNQATLHDATGKVIATKNLFSASDATEITVGTDYLVRFEGINYTVTPGTNPDLAVSVSVLASTDKIADLNGASVTAAITSGSIRTVNGMGFTDSVGGAALSGSTLPTTGAGANTFVFGSTSSNQADIYTRISPNSNPIEHPQAISVTQTTPSVSLGTYSLKSQNQSGTLNSVSFTIQTNPSVGGPITNLFSNIRLQDGSQSYGGTVSSNTVSFTNLTIGLTQDQWKDLTIVADVAATTTTIRASSTLVKSTIVGTDVNYNNLGTSNASNQTASNVVLTTNSLVASGMSAAIFPGIADVANGPVQRYPVSYTFTLTNTSSNTLYVPADVSTFVGTSSGGNASSTIYLIEPVAPANGDVSGTSYAVSAGGGSRTFTVNGTIKKSSNTSSGEYLRITSIRYYADSAVSGTQLLINSGLEALYKAATF